MLAACGFALAVGTLASFVSLDLEPVVAGLHFGMYFAATILLRLAMGLDALPGMTG
jgi:hypothetical protein